VQRYPDVTRRKLTTNSGESLELGVSIAFPVTVFILPPTMTEPVVSSEPAGPDAIEVIGQGRYAVTGMLGEGSQGETLEAVDKRDGRLVAIKRFRIKGAASWKDVELAEREAHVLSALEHPNLPRYVEHFEESGVLYLVMDRVTGEALGGFKGRTPLDQHAVVQLLNDMADLLDYLHLRAPPIIHRDIKPGNIIRRPDGSFALVDFGSVRDRLKPDGGSTVVGTFGYMAPEQFQGRALPVTDVYGVGATALALLTGRDPDALPHQGLGLDVARALAGQVDARLVHVLAAMLRPDPDQRAPRLATLLSEQRLRLRPGERAGRAAAARPEAEVRHGRSRTDKRTDKRRRREHKRERREQRRREWRAHAGQGSPGDFWLFKNVLLLPLILMGLQIAKLATWALFAVMLPIVFNVLSLFFGPRLRRAGEGFEAVGRRGHWWLTQVSQSLVWRSDRAAAARDRAREASRVRVDTHERRRVVDDRSELPSEDAPVEEDGRAREASRRR